LRILADDRADASANWRKPTGAVCWSGRPLKIPAGFPPVAVYALLPDHIQNEPLLIDGPRPIRYSRTVDEAEIGLGGVEGGLDRDDARLEWIASLLGVRTADVGIARSTLLSVGPLSGPAFLEAVGSARRDVTQRLDLIADRLLKDGVLSKGERAAIRPRVRVVVTDRRQDTTAPLPTLPSSWTELEPPAPPPQGEPKPPVAPPAPAAPAPKADLPREAINLGGGVTFDMVLIPAGEFDMGSPETEKGRFDDEALHRVRLTQPYWLATTEVTQAVWTAVMGSNPSKTKGAMLPVTEVSWDDCEAFLKHLNRRVVGGGFRLPTEAEWEYACRAGSRGRYCFGDDEEGLAEHAWYETSSGWIVHPVGTLKPNVWGFYDMHGNVWEWCQDVYEELPVASRSKIEPMGRDNSRARVFRGAGWGTAEAYVRAAIRFGRAPRIRTGDTGLRLARTVPPDAPPPQPPASTPPAQPPPSALKPGDPALPVAPPAKEAEVPSWAKVAPEQVEAAKKAGVLVAFENLIGMRFVLIPGGAFTMGSPETEEGRSKDETQHEVTLTRPYYMGVTEVTNAQFRRFRPLHDSSEWGSSLNGEGQPVVAVSLADADAFARWLTRQDQGRTYELPTEAQWERACRAGTTTAYWWGETITRARANYRETDEPLLGRAEGTTIAVGILPANAWGLHEVHGNVYEFVMDSYGEYPTSTVSDPAAVKLEQPSVVRGGSFLTGALYLRSAKRRSVPNPRPSEDVGFRLVVSVPAK
jgi:formylglycine-generating enzyme required for sulfatase activity